MNFITKMLQDIYQLSNKIFIQIIIIIIFLIILISGFFIYRFYSKKHTLISDVKKIYELKNKTGQLIEEKKSIEKEKDNIIQIINEDINFKPIQFFDNVLEELRLKNYLDTQKVSLKNIENSEYEEVNLDVYLKSLNTKQMVELIKAIENNKRVYIKNLNIIKTPKIANIDISMTITTLQSKSD